MTLRVTRWAIAIVGGMLVMLAIIAGGGSRTATLRQLVIDTLADRLDSEVQLDAFGVDTFPVVHITGTNLVIRHKGRRDVPPLVSVRVVKPRAVAAARQRAPPSEAQLLAPDSRPRRSSPPAPRCTPPRFPPVPCSPRAPAP